MIRMDSPSVSAGQTTSPHTSPIGTEGHLAGILRIDGERSRRWSDEEVVERYGGLFPRTVELWQGFPQARNALPQ
jgi:hypothetical protein